jgi:putative FmdB family regulatory protein
LFRSILQLFDESDSMPTYEYECPKCGHQFEESQSITAEPRKSCPQKGCRGRVRRLISAGGGLLFKGSGFYVTDYRSEGYQKAAKADGESASTDKAKKDDGKKSESAKKTDTKSSTSKKESE